MCYNFNMAGENMNVKCIVMDMDGTLLKSDNTIDENTKNILIELEKKGVTLILASGRSYRKMLKYAKELEMDQFGGYLLEVNGMYLYNLKTDERIRFGELTKNDVQIIYDYLMPFNLETMCLIDDGIFDYIPKHIMVKKRNT